MDMVKRRNQLEELLGVVACLHGAPAGIFSLHEHIRIRRTEHCSEVVIAAVVAKLRFRLICRARGRFTMLNTQPIRPAPGFEKASSLKPLFPCG